MGIAEPRWRRARRQIVHALVGQDRRRRIEQRHVDVGALTGDVSAPQRGQYGGRRVQSGENIDDGDADLLRLAVGLTGNVHQPAHALDDIVVSGALGVGSVLAEAGNRGVNQ